MHQRRRSTPHTFEDRIAAEKVKLEAHNLERKKEADAIAKKLGGQTFLLIRQAGDRGQLYGSVTPRDVATVMEAGGFKVDRHQVQISQAIKTIGLFVLPVVLHPEVKVNITINVARSEDEALRQARGENVLAGRTEQEEAVIAAEELFEEGAGPTAQDGDATEEEPTEA